MKYKFKCSNCDCEELELIEAGVIACSTVTSINDDSIDYGKIELGDDSDESYYQCANCGMIIAKDDKELREKLIHMPFAKIKREYILELINIFENFLDTHNVAIENPERSTDPEDGHSMFYGSLYDELEADIIEHLHDVYNIKVSDMIQGDGDETFKIKEN